MDKIIGYNDTVILDQTRSKPNKTYVVPGSPIYRPKFVFDNMNYAAVVIDSRLRKSLEEQWEDFMFEEVCKEVEDGR